MIVPPTAHPSLAETMSMRPRTTPGMDAAPGSQLQWLKRSSSVPCWPCVAVHLLSSEWNSDAAGTETSNTAAIAERTENLLRRASRASGEDVGGACEAGVWSAIPSLVDEAVHGCSRVRV